MSRSAAPAVRRMPARRTVDLRLLPAAASAWLTAVLVPLIPLPGTRWSVLGAVLAGAVLLVLGFRGRTLRRILLTVCCGGVLVLVPLCLAGEDPVARQLQELTEQQETARMLVLPQDDPREVASVHGSRWALSARIGRVQTGQETVAGSVPCTLWFSEDPTDRIPSDGAGLVVAGTVRDPLSDRCAVSVAAVLGPVPRDGPGSDPSGGAPGGEGAGQEDRDPGLLEGLTELTRERAERLLPQDPAALVLGMAYGDDSGLSPRASDDLKTAGLTHLTAVSGSNVAIVFLLGVHALRWTRCPRVLSIGSGLVAVGAYLALVGPDPSVLRATVMGVLGGLAMATGSGGAASAALWTSMVLLLAVDPALGTDAGFVLSVLATAGILLQGGAACRLACLVLWRWLAEAVSVTVVASLWCLPYLVHLSGFWGPYTVLTNVAVAPVVPVGTVCGLLAVCLARTGAPADLLVQAAGWPARWIDAVGRWSASWPGARLETGDGIGTVLGCIVLVLAAAVVVFLADPARRAGVRELPDNLAASLHSATRPVPGRDEPDPQPRSSPGGHRATTP